jgi:hypothetical protein
LLLAGNAESGVRSIGKEHRMIQLTKEQHDELAKNGQDTAKVIDPVTKTEYVLVRADLYEYRCGLIDVDFHVSDTYPAIDQAFAELWSDPKMSDYDHYEDFKK